MSQIRRIPTKYTPEFRDEAVSFVINSGESAAKCSSKLGVNETTLATWVTAYRKRSQVGLVTGFAENAKIRELEKELSQLKLELEFTKKATAYFARLLP